MSPQAADFTIYIAIGCAVFCALLAVGLIIALFLKSKSKKEGDVEQSNEQTDNISLQSAESGSAKSEYSSLKAIEQMQNQASARNVNQYDVGDIKGF